MLDPPRPPRPPRTYFGNSDNDFSLSITNEADTLISCSLLSCAHILSFVFISGVENIVFASMYMCVIGKGSQALVFH